MGSIVECWQNQVVGKYGLGWMVSCRSLTNQSKKVLALSVFTSPFKVVLTRCQKNATNWNYGQF